MNLNCHEPIEALYYSAKYEPICVYCAKPQAFTDEKQYPQCSDCKDNPAAVANFICIHFVKPSSFVLVVFSF